jgi:lysozyme family protein
MAASSYDEALRRLLVHEGGYSNHPSDPGGPTKFGITLADYRKYVKRNATAADVRAMPVGEAKAIYRGKYWNAMRCDELAAGVDYCLFDYAVNSGTGRAPKVLQRLLGCPVTGRMDDTTVRLANARDPKRLIAEICDERLRFLRSLRTWPVFGSGWSRRVHEVGAVALALADRKTDDRRRRSDDKPQRTGEPSKHPPSVVRQPPSGKGVVPANRPAEIGAAGGALAAGGAAAAQSNKPAVVIAILAVALLAAIAVWLVLRWRRRRRQDAAVNT